MRILIVSPVPIHPAHGGDRARILAFVREFRSGGHEVHFALLSSRQMGDCDFARHREDFGTGLHLLERDRLGRALYLAGRSFDVLRHRLRKLTGRRGYRFHSIDAIYYRSFTGRLSGLAEQIRPDVFMVAYAYFSRAFDAAPEYALKALDTLDSFPHEIPAAQEGRGRARAGVVIAIHEQEVAYFRRLIPERTHTIHTVGHILPTRDPLPLAATAGATFIGSPFRANIVSLTGFIAHVLPLILQEEPAFRLTIAGSICGDIADHPAIVKLGRVDDIGDEFAASPILINFITEGTGLKIKLVEAMSLGVPGVSTRFGVEGVDDDLLNGVAIVADGDHQAFAAEVVSLHRDHDLRRRRGAAAHADAMRWNDLHRCALHEALAPAVRHP